MHRTRRYLCVFLVFCILVALAILYFLNPTEYIWMPKCPTKLFFGIDCPGCGFQRSVHALLHGRIIESFSYNPFLYLAAPYALLSITSRFITNKDKRHKLERILESKTMTYGYIFVFFVWFVIRNIR